MRIGIDMDGVLTDLTRFVTDYGIKFCYENHIKYKIHPKGQKNFPESHSLNF